MRKPAAETAELIVLEVLPEGKVRVMCPVDGCGFQWVLRRGNLGRTRSCGCLRQKNFNHLIHGARSRTNKEPLYSVWANMLSRCRNTKRGDYLNYGARGISVCPEWSDYPTFRDWAQTNGYSPELYIDRKDNCLGYSPDNCHFVTKSRNNRNRRDTWFETAFGETKSLMDWAEDSRCQVPYKTLVSRLKQLNWGIERALTTPPSSYRRVQPYKKA